MRRQIYRHRDNGMFVGMHSGYADNPLLELVEVDETPQGLVPVTDAPAAAIPEEAPSIDAPEGLLGSALPEPKPKPVRRRKAISAPRTGSRK